MIISRGLLFEEMRNLGIERKRAMGDPGLADPEIWEGLALAQQRWRSVIDQVDSQAQAIMLIVFLNFAEGRGQSVEQHNAALRCTGSVTA